MYAFQQNCHLYQRCLTFYNHDSKRLSVTRLWSKWHGIKRLSLILIVWMWNESGRKENERKEDGRKRKMNGFLSYLNGLWFGHPNSPHSTPSTVAILMSKMVGKRRRMDVHVTFSYFNWVEKRENGKKKKQNLLSACLNWWKSEMEQKWV